MARIFVSDDDDIFSEFVIDLLMDAGHVVGHCRNGREALAALRFRPPQLLILDCNMPEMSGIEVLREMHQDRALYNIPVLMLTARASPGDERIARYDGADDYLTKPIIPEELLRRVESLLARGVSKAPIKGWVDPPKRSSGQGTRLAV